MNMIKQCAVFALAAITGLAASVAWAAREEHIFEVSLTIPSRAFYILPAEPGWIHQAQLLKWDYPTSTLGSLRKNFDVRHDTSAIEARLEAPAYLADSRSSEIIGLRVLFNGVLLSPNPNPQQVVSQADAAVGTRVLLEIEPMKPADGYRPGDYSGNVLLLFNARAPGA
jgi:hypothetical protein